jgi:hypothetical protein
MMKESITLKDVYAISERENPSAEGPDGKGRWTRIGIGFVNRDNSINVVLDAIPLNGRFQIRDRKPKTEEYKRRPS